MQMLGYFIMGQSQKLKTLMSEVNEEDLYIEPNYRQLLCEAYANYIWRLKNGYVKFE